MSICTEQTRYDNIRAQRGPAGVKCPFCHLDDHVYYSSAQLRRPIAKRALFCYLRCHSCTHRFRHVRLGVMVFAGFAATLLAFAGILG